MCMPWNHDWKRHWKVYHDTRWDFFGPTRLGLLGQQCKKCGKFERIAEGAKKPERGRVRRNGPRMFV